MSIGQDEDVAALTTSSVPIKPPTSGGRLVILQKWPASLVLGVGIALVYLANGREIGAFDTVPTNLLPMAIVRGDGPTLDRFRPLFWRVWRTPSPVFVAESRGHVVSCYPLAPALVALPLVAPQIMLLDAIEPRWDRDPVRVHAEVRRMAKRAAAILAALVAVALHRLLVGLGLARVTLASVVAIALGSDLWSVASQSLWQHGPAALFLTVTMLLLQPSSGSRGRMLLAGLSTAMLVASRFIDLVFALFVLAWVARTHPRRLAWFLPVPVLLGLAVVRYNLYYFGNLAGGLDQLERVHRQIHGVQSTWSGNLMAGMAGTLFSPNRGLFIFSPWVAIAIAVAPAALRRLEPGSLPRWLLPALVPYLLVLSKYAVWWGGGSFGPRYWTDAMPLFGVLLACGLDWARDRSRVVLAFFALAIVFSVGVQVIGAFCYPSTWNFSPTDSDLNHERFWDWRDLELARCVKEWLQGRAPLF
jgi:hypothetical protein